MTRRIAINSDDREVIVTDNGSYLGSIRYPRVAAEIVRRYNAHHALVQSAERAAQLLDELRTALAAAKGEVA